ncbi:phage tail assembly protein [Brevibacterium moorei]|uniref:phage tail assembly protein n=1 Tax=Brevibacterium moorei TaxID=2968457 RepID=UPI00211CD9C8|nr:phage tail assembly protein [Brevibacterium sp. 68QC2CO]MCQ9385116.1 phage tail assembly protein [Brevibacterium sp. 68QC2CO]
MKLSDIRNAADTKFAPFLVELDDDRQVELRVPIRLDKKERKAVTAAFDVEDKDDKDAFDIYTEVFRIVIADKADADALIAALDNDLAVAQELFNDYSEQTQLGEAASSEN